MELLTPKLGQVVDLTLKNNVLIDDLCFGLWSMSFGLLVLDHARDMISGLQLSPSDELMLTQMTNLLDGYQWHPLSSEQDYHGAYQRALEYLGTTQVKS